MAKNTVQLRSVQGVSIGAVQVLVQLLSAQPKALDDALQNARSRARTMQQRRGDLQGLVLVEDVLHAAGKLLDAKKLSALKEAVAGLEDVPQDGGESGGGDRITTAVDRFNEQRSRR